MSTTSLRLKRSWLLVGILLVLCVISPVAEAVESGGVGGQPARPDPKNPRTGSIFVFDMKAGSAAENAVKLYNNSDTTKTIEIYAVDSQISSGGAFACAQKAEEPKSVGNWIRLDKNRVTLPRGGSQEVTFTLAVPDNASGGEHNGCIAIQEADQVPTASGTNGIALSFRSAIRVAVTVEGDITKGLAFTRLESRSGKDEKRVISVGIRNSGNVSLDSDVDVRIKTLIGTTVRQVGGEFPVLAGAESELNFETSEPFWGGIYLLGASAKYNPDPAAGIGDSSQSTSVGRTEILMITPKPLAAAIELAVFLAVVTGAAIFWRRRRLQKRWHGLGKVYVVKDGESIQQIAERFDVPWKAVARVNRLKAPYHLKAGDRLRLLPKALETKRKTRKSKK